MQILLRIVLTVLFILICVGVTVVILAQQGRDEGLGSLGGMSNSNSYWSQNRSRSLEGNLLRITRLLVALVIVFAIVLNLGF